MFRAVSLISPPPAAAPRHQGGRPRRDKNRVRLALSAVGAGLDALAILGAAAVAALSQAAVGPTDLEIWRDFLCLGTVAAIIFVGASLVRGDYGLATCLAREGLFRRTLSAWATAMVSAFALAFAFHIGGSLPPAALLGFGATGLAVVYALRFGFRKAAAPHVRPRGMAERRLFLIGYEDEIKLFGQRYESRLVGTHVVAATVLRGRETLEEDLTLACASARILQPDDVFILVPWAETATVDACVDAFLRLPTAIHLGPDASFERFAEAEVAKVGPVPSINLVRRPLAPLEVATKRAMDIVLAGLALLLLAPLLAAVAVAIKLDSPGPVIFRQRRYGFNQRPFRIFKFRSMRTLEDSANLRQVVAGDERVTRLGNFMRRYNIDELPQLINVLIGDMSLVGPRPHALAHDQMFGRSIALYSRRHNVKPGITGWAQVNGFRGGFSDQMMRARVEHDLYYIDNWSLWLDIKILWLTLMSKKSYRNAY